MFDWLFGEDMDIEDVGEALATEPNKMKRRLLLLQKFLYENTDEQHPITTFEINDNISTFRADRVCNMEILDERAAKKPAGFNVEKFSHQVFGMYDTGETVKVIKKSV